MPEGGSVRSDLDDLGVITLDDLGGRLFATVPEVAAILRYDVRTVRRAIEAGTVPAVRVGAGYRIPMAWLRSVAGATAPASSTA